MLSKKASGGPKWFESENPICRVAILFPSVKGTVAVDIKRCFRAVWTAVFSLTRGELKAEITEPSLPKTARERSKSSAEALAMMLKSFLNVVSCLAPPNAIFVFWSSSSERMVLAKTMANLGLSHLHIAFAR